MFYYCCESINKGFKRHYCELINKRFKRYCCELGIRNLQSRKLWYGEKLFELKSKAI